MAPPAGTGGRMVSAFGAASLAVEPKHLGFLNLVETPAEAVAAIRAGTQ